MACRILPYRGSKYVVDGAQDPQDFLEVFVRVKETEAAQSETGP